MICKASDFTKILKHSVGSQFGQEHHFSEIKSYEDFIHKVSVTEYDDYRAYIEDICKNGDKRQLFDGKKWII